LTGDVAALTALAFGGGTISPLQPLVFCGTLSSPKEQQKHNKTTWNTMEHHGTAKIKKVRIKPMEHHHLRS
jgi:hypothetical protein